MGYSASGNLHYKFQGQQDSNVKLMSQQHKAKKIMDLSPLSNFFSGMLGCLCTKYVLRK